jgi:hypothetical protein
LDAAVKEADPGQREQGFRGHGRQEGVVLESLEGADIGVVHERIPPWAGRPVAA